MSKVLKKDIEEAAVESNSRSPKIAGGLHLGTQLCELVALQQFLRTLLIFLDEPCFDIALKIVEKFSEMLLALQRRIDDDGILVIVQERNISSRGLLDVFEEAFRLDAVESQEDDDVRRTKPIDDSYVQVATSDHEAVNVRD